MSELYAGYVSKLAETIEEFWNGSPIKSKTMLTQIEKDYKYQYGLLKAGQLNEMLDPWLRHWKETINSYTSDFSQPNEREEYEFLFSGSAPQIIALAIKSESESIEDIPSIEPSEISIQIQINSMEEKLQEINQLYNHFQIIEAYQKLEELKQIYNIDLNCFTELEEITRDYKQTMDFLEYFNDNEGWIEDKSKDGVSVSYKRLENSPTVSILTESTMEIPLEHFMAVAYETDLYTNWIPFLKNCSTVAVLPRARKIILQEYKIVGVAHREALIYGCGFDMLKTHGIVLIESKSVDDQPTFEGVSLPPPGKVVRSEVNFVGIELKPLDRKKTHIKLVTNFDPKMRIIPYKVLNYFSRKIAHGIYKRIEKLAENFEGSEYERLRHDPVNREFYDMIQSALDEYFG